MLLKVSTSGNQYLNVCCQVMSNHVFWMDNMYYIVTFGYPLGHQLRKKNDLFSATLKSPRLNYDRLNGFAMIWKKKRMICD